MREMEQLPPDQRAVLSLVLTQQKSYAEVASLLGVSEQSVRERAHAALDALATQGAANGASIPASPDRSPASPARHVPSRPSSKTGGAILLGTIAVAVAVVAIVLSSGGGKSSAQSAGKPAAPSTSSSSSRPASGGGETGGVHLDKQLSLSPTEPSSRASGEGIVVSNGSRLAFYVKTSGLSPTSGFYAVWLYKSASDAFPLGKLPPVDSKGRAEGGGPLTPKLSNFDKLVITRETSQNPSTPGPIVLSAPLR